MKKYILFFFCFLSINTLKAEYLNIGILGAKEIKSFKFSIQAGQYVLFSEEGKVLSLDSTTEVQVVYRDMMLEVYDKKQLLGTFDKLNFVGVGWHNYFSISSESPTKLTKYYDDNLKVHSQRRGMLLVNNVNIDNYVKGVVEAEVGRRAPEEYFKTQAIICRTYALSHTYKHALEGINLCDEVHCQVYNGKCFFSPIINGTMQTSGLVVVDSSIQLITAAFHSNCGGQTLNSERVWSKPLYYLQGKRDTFCLNQQNAHWSRQIPKRQWTDYLREKLSLQDLNAIEKYIPQKERAPYFLQPNSGLTYEDIRNHFKLKSAFFEIEDKGEYIQLKGRGYGHGVGLCQEGAMEMARQNYSYSEILHFYFTGVHIIDLSALDFFRDN